MIEGKVITLGVTGGIAVYKVADLSSKLTGQGASVHTIMTRSALEFVSPLTFEALTKNPVHTDLFSSSQQFKIPHIELATSADLMLIAPATANIIGKLAQGIADDLLSTSVLAATCPILICPAMNINMYANPVVQDNIQKLKSYGYHFVEPEVGTVACGHYGKGRFPNNNVILEAVCGILAQTSDMQGLTIMVTAGGTKEAIDPVRYISNRSTGKMGYALAKAAVARGARVILISTPTSLDVPDGVEFVQVESALEMREAVLRNFPQCQVVIKAAAVADYRCEAVSEQKIKKGEDTLVLKLIRNPDILAELGKDKKGGITLVGFAAETENLEYHARQKMIAKNTDLLVANDVTMPGAGFGSDTNVVKLYYKNGVIESLPKMSKLEVAYKIMDAVIRIRGGNSL